MRAPPMSCTGRLSSLPWLCWSRPLPPPPHALWTHAWIEQPPAGGVPPRPLQAASGPAAAQQQHQDLKRQVAALQKHLAVAEARAAAAESNAEEAAVRGGTAEAGKASRGKVELTEESESVSEAAVGVKDWSEASLEAVHVDQAELRGTIASLRSHLEAALSAAVADKQEMSAAVTDARDELAFEADRRVALEREVTALRSRLQQQQQHQQQHQGVGGTEQAVRSAEHERVAEAEASLAELQAVCSRQAEDVAAALRRADAAEGELAAARASITDLAAASDSSLQEYARETATAQAEAEAVIRTEAASVHTVLQRRLQEAESRAISLGEELEAALRAKEERDVQASKAAAVAASETLKVFVASTYPDGWWCVCRGHCVCEPCWCTSEYL